MKTHFIIAGCLGLLMWSVAAQGQNLVWAKQFGGTAEDRGNAITTDSFGNVYCTGWFNGTVDFDPGPGTFNLTSPSGGVFIFKLNSAGDLIWAKQLVGGSGWGRSIAIDAAQNLVITGHFSGTADFDLGPGTYNLSSAGSNDIFILKIDGSGNFIWAKQIGGFTADFGHSVTTDNANNVYVTGSFTGTVDFDPDSGTFNLNGGTIYDVFVLKLNSSGNFMWAQGAGSNSSDEGFGIAIDGLGNVYVTGRYCGLFYYNGGSLPAPPPVCPLIFCLKMDTSVGSVIWAKHLIGVVYSNSIATDQSGNVYVTGGFEGTADLDPNAGVFNLTSAGDEDVFIVKLDDSGNLVWAQQMGDTLREYGNSIAVDNIGNTYVTGSQMYGKLDSLGNLIWTQQFQGNEGLAVNVVENGNVFVAGKFSGTSDFDSGSGTYNLSSAGSTDVFVLKLNSSTNSFLIEGKIFEDINANCSMDSSDLSLAGKLIKAEPGPFYGMSGYTGDYSIYLPDTGSYSISLVTQDTLRQPSCTTSYNVQLTGTSDTVSGIDLIVRAAFYCPRLTVELGTPFLRRCFNSTYTVHYANTGTVPASNAYIEVDFGDSLQPQSSSLPWTAVSGNVYTFPIGNINVNERGSFNVKAYIDCNIPLGITQCVTAYIYPDSVCAVPSTGWDKSETKVTGGCINDSLVCFMIKNHSSPPSGNMQGTAPWRLYINDTLVTQGSYQLAGQDSLIQCYPANGKTYRLEADQRLGHPGNSHPQAIVEACGSPDNFGFVNTVAQDDEDLFVETFCMTVIGSYDPNDKQVFPTGITTNKYIKPYDELEYLIRFQNTGNDTAFKVVIRDTIQTDVIDIATLTSGASSHDYTFNIYGHGIAEWTFNNILLPDSNVNEPESHGFVKFKAKLLPNIPPGTIVTNSADIYFDFNAPVITNEVWNTVFDTVLRAPVTISGAVLTESNTPVAGVTVKLSGSVTDSVVTAADGRYDFEVEPGGSYTITPLKNNDAIPQQGIDHL